jgi:hypothetical protein
MEVARRADGGGLIVEAELPRAAWPGFVDTLRQAGTLTIEAEPAGPGDRLRVVLRIGA